MRNHICPYLAKEKQVVLAVVPQQHQMVAKREKEKNNPKIPFILFDHTYIGLKKKKDGHVLVNLQ